MSGHRILRRIPRRLQSHRATWSICRSQERHPAMTASRRLKNLQFPQSRSSYLRRQTRTSTSRTSNPGQGLGKTFTRTDLGLGQIGNMGAALSRFSKAIKMESCVCSFQNLRTFLPQALTMQPSRFGIWTLLKKYVPSQGIRVGFERCSSIQRN